MDPAKFQQLVDGVEAERKSLLGLRGEEYAKDFDQLTSFKEVSAIWNILHIDKILLPSDIAEILVILKQMRLVNLKRQDLNPETVKFKDTYLDLHNYIDLQVACLLDERDSSTNALRES